MSNAQGNIEVRNIFKVFGDQAANALALVKGGASKQEVLAKAGCNVGLKDVSLHIPGGQIFVIMGLSGSGKSTLVRHFNRLIEPTAGEILVNGRSVLQLNTEELQHLRRHAMSMVFQSFGLLPHKTVFDNVAYGMRVRGDKEDAVKASVDKWIERVGLKGYDKSYPDELSGGMRQRVGLARALAMDPQVLLMDEAFSALDPLIRYDMQTLLLELQSTMSKTIVFITHDLDEALRIGAHIAILRDGELVQVGTPQDIVQNPANDYVRRFVERRSH